ncbi:MAG TPA: NHL repeat-containing protein [Myxococcota bacterium]|nr:NHL repeat-containing protein [Myxococcota bacterium]
MLSQWSLLILLFVLCAAVHAGHAASLAPGDLVVGNLSGGQVLRVDATSGEVTVIASGGLLSRPIGVAVDGSGDLIVVDNGVNAVIRIDPDTGIQSLVSEAPVNPVGVAIHPDGSILVSDDDYSEPIRSPIKRIDPLTGASSQFASGSNLFAPGGIAVAQNGDVFVSSRSARHVVRIDAASGSQSIVATAISTFGIAVDPMGDLFAADFQSDTVFHIDSMSGTKGLIATIAGAPFGLALAADGHLFLADQRGRVLRVDPSNGDWTVFASIPGATAVAVVPVPVPEPATAVLLLVGLVVFKQRRVPLIR